MTTSTELKRKLERVLQVGLSLVRSDDLQKIVHLATDAGRELCGAQFGAFFYNVTDASGQSYRLYTLSGIKPEVFDKFPQPRNTQVWAPTFEGRAVVRSRDITKDPRYGQNPPYHGVPAGHPPVRSFLSVPVNALSGETLGGLFYGHGRADVFDQESEQVITAIAAQAAVAIENARLREQLTGKIKDLEDAGARHRETARHLSQLASIVESTDDAIISKDLAGRIVSWNPAATRILGFSPEEMIGESILKIMPPEMYPQEDEILAKIREGRRIEHFETVRMTKAGKRLDVSLTISPLRDDTGKVVGASKILRDVSERKRMEHTLLQSEKIAATGRMAATIAHEINNPLESVVNLIYLARTRAEDPEQIEYLSAAEGEVERVSHIARQTLGYYREHTSAGKVSLSALAADAIHVYRPRCEAAGIRIETHFESSRQLVVRKGEMMQVISNLIANAIQSMPSGGTLTLAVKDEPEAVTLCVDDTGVGIPADVLPRIFEAFFTTREAIGTGIGLFVAKQFVEGHGGSITIESSADPENHGTRTTIHLPLRGPYSGASTNGHIPSPEPA